MNTKKLLLAALLSLLPLSAFAQIDNFGAVDTLYAEMFKINDYNWGVTVSYFNDENVEAFSIPLHFSAKDNKLFADSVIFAGGRAES